MIIRRVLAVACLLAPMAVQAAAKDVCTRPWVEGVLAGRLNMPEDVLSFACKTHPVRPGHVIVAWITEVDAEAEKANLTVAVVDTVRKRVASLDRSNFDVDAAVRIWPSSLSIDTARYVLADGVRAFGVRMQIAHSPRCADAGEDDYMRMFVEDGGKLHMVLKDLPMSRWAKIDGESTCSGERFTAERIKVTLSMLPTASEGWKDIAIIERRVEEASDAEPSSPTTTRAGVLRARGRQYERR